MILVIIIWIMRIQKTRKGRQKHYMILKNQVEIKPLYKQRKTTKVLLQIGIILIYRFHFSFLFSRKIVVWLPFFKLFIIRRSNLDQDYLESPDLLAVRNPVQEQNCHMEENSNSSSSATVLDTTPKVVRVNEFQLNNVGTDSSKLGKNLLCDPTFDFTEYLEKTLAEVDFQEIVERNNVNEAPP